MSERTGIILPEVFDGVSVWIEPDGSYTNRWASVSAQYPKDRSLRARADKAQAWIEDALAQRVDHG